MKVSHLVLARVLPLVVDIVHVIGQHSVHKTRLKIYDNKLVLTLSVHLLY